MKRKFRVSLKFALISLGFIGASIGVLGRLYLFQPEVFLWVIQGSIGLGFVAQILAVVYWSRNRTTSKAVIFLPYVVTMVIFLILKSTGVLSDPIRFLPTWYLTQEKLFNFRGGRLVDDSRVWRELDRRLMNNNFSNSDAEAVFEKYEQEIRRQTKLPRAQLFSTTPLRTMASRDMVSDAQLVSLGLAYYGKPSNKLLRVRTSESPISLSVRYGHAGVDIPHPTKLLWETSRIRIDGQDVEFKVSGSGSHAADIHTKLTAGEYEMRVDLDCALVMHDDVPRIFGGRCPVDRWPRDVKKRWIETLVIPLSIYGEDDEIISLVSDPDLNPFDHISFHIDTLSKTATFPEWLLHTAVDENLPVAISGDLTVVIDGERFDGGSISRYPGQPVLPGKHAFLHPWKLDPAKIQSHKATIEFVPNPALLERASTVNAIWGEKMEFKRVPIARKK